MRKTFGQYTAAHPWIGAAGDRSSVAVTNALLRRRRVHQWTSEPSRRTARSLREKLDQGRTVRVVGLGPAFHNTGVSLVEASAEDGIRLVTNNEEERYSGTKHCADFPEGAIADLRAQLAAEGLDAGAVDGIASSFDYSRALSLRLAVEEAPQSLRLVTNFASMLGLGDVLKPRNLIKPVLSAYDQLASGLGGTGDADHIVGMDHHANHAAFSYAVSPWGGSETDVLVGVFDGAGESAGSSVYAARGSAVRLLARTASIWDSLGFLYGVLSSTQGGWTLLSSEGRYMGATAWGDMDRLSNHYYRELREILHLAPGGRLYLNRHLANWHRDMDRPYSADLRGILGDPIGADRMWNPDAVLDVENIRHPELTKERLDRAAAVQMVFEDGLIHVLDHAIRTTRANRLVLSGGCALNCLANMRLLETFDEEYFERHLHLPDTRLHLWVPPIPNDSGAPPGAAFSLLLKAGARPGAGLRHAFYCGSAPTSGEIERALRADRAIGWKPVGGDEVAETMASFVARDGVVGLFQGVAETGPRALGHRSILANPCNPETRLILNQRVKFRELVRPLAPMMTLAAARRYFELDEGASDAEWNAYNYMVLTVRATPLARQTIPAVVHEDGTSRIQIVRPDVDPLTHAYLEALGRHIGVEVSVNTSLNVGGPIVQTPAQALATMHRAKGLDGLFLVGSDGRAFLAWTLAGEQRVARWLEPRSAVR